MNNSWTNDSAPDGRTWLRSVARATGLLLPGLAAALVMGCSDGTPADAPTAPLHAAKLDMAGGGGAPVHYPEPPWPMDFPAGSVCSFEVVATPVQNNSLVAQYPPDSNGDVVQRVTGLFVQQLTNTSNGKSMTVNLSGPITFTLHADGSTTVLLNGPTLAWFFATDIPASRMIIINGHAVVNVSATGQETLQTIDGTQLDVCAALS